MLRHYSVMLYICSPLGDNIVPRRSDFVFVEIPRKCLQSETSGITRPPPSTLTPAISNRPFIESKSVANPKQHAPTSVEQKPSPSIAAPRTTSSDNNHPASSASSTSGKRRIQREPIVAAPIRASGSVAVPRQAGETNDRAAKQSRNANMIAVHSPMSSRSNSGFPSLPMPDSQPPSFVVIDEASIAAATILCLLSQHPLS